MKEAIDFLSWVGVALVTLLPIINPVSTAVLLLSMGLLQNSWKCHSEEHEVRRRISNSLHGTKSRFFAALRMTMLKVGFVLSQQSSVSVSI